MAKVRRAYAYADKPAVYNNHLNRRVYRKTPVYVCQMMRAYHHHTTSCFGVTAQRAPKQHTAYKKKPTSHHSSNTKYIRPTNESEAAAAAAAAADLCTCAQPAYSTLHTMVGESRTRVCVCVVCIIFESGILRYVSHHQQHHLILSHNRMRTN